MKRFKDIRTREELLERVVDGVLSVGNQYSYINHLLHKVKTRDDQVLVEVIYTRSGKHSIMRYI